MSSTCVFSQLQAHAGDTISKADGSQLGNHTQIKTYTVSSCHS